MNRYTRWDAMRDTARHMVVVAMVSMVAGCGGGGASQSSQSLVRVNGDEITIHQLNAQLQGANISPDKSTQAGQELLKLLVDRQILVQEAIKTNVERQPGVMQALENARARILAQAYLEEKLARLPRPTAAEVAAYRNAHPALFAARTLYVMEQLVFDPVSDQAALTSLSETASELEQVKSWLEARKVAYTQTTTTYRPEAMAPELLARLQTMKPGELIFLSGNGRTVVGQMAERIAQPLSEKESRPLIEQLIARQQQTQAVESEVTRLRKLASIEYLNQKYAPPASGNKAAATPSTEQGVAGL